MRILNLVNVNVSHRGVWGYGFHLVCVGFFFGTLVNVNVSHHGV